MGVRKTLSPKSKALHRRVVVLLLSILHEPPGLIRANFQLPGGCCCNFSEAYLRGLGYRAQGAVVALIQTV